MLLIYENSTSCILMLLHSYAVKLSNELKTIHNTLNFSKRKDNAYNSVNLEIEVMYFTILNHSNVINKLNVI